MNGSANSENHTSFHRSVEDVDGDIWTYHGNEYVIRGLQLGDGFGIGLSYAGDGAPPEDIVPLEVYEAVEDTVRTQVDIEAVRRWTTPDVWPHVGTCRLSVSEDGSVTVVVEIGDLGEIES